jgi:hypothetical protein
MSDEQINEHENLNAIIPEQPISSIIQVLKDASKTYEDKITEIHDELEQIFIIDHERLVDENIKTVSRLHYWISKKAVESRLLLKIKRKRNFVYSCLYEDYREGKNGRGNVTLSKDGIEAYVTKNSEYIRWNNLMEEQEIIVEYIDQLCWALKQTKMQALKNIQDSKKLETGY